MYLKGNLHGIPLVVRHWPEMRNNYRNWVQFLQLKAIFKKLLKLSKKWCLPSLFLRSVVRVSSGLGEEAFKVTEGLLKIGNFSNTYSEFSMKSSAYPCCFILFFILFIALISFNLWPVRKPSSFRVSLSSPVSKSNRMSKVMCSSLNIFFRLWRRRSARNFSMLMVSES